MLHPVAISGPLFSVTQFKDVKDPCVVHDDTLWHIYGSGGDVRNEHWQILHATAPSLVGPWQEVAAVNMVGLHGEHVAAPSVYFDTKDSTFHMIVQTEFTTIGGSIEYLTSTDGYSFTRKNTALTSLAESTEAGIYDPHQVVIDDQKYIVYAGTPAIEGFHGQYIIQPDVHLARCTQQNPTQSSWEGPWERLGVILDHTHIDWHHNHRAHQAYEWGIEGPQIVRLPNNTYLLNATCFLSEGAFGTRQRVFFAISENIEGPYTSLGPVIDPTLYPEYEWLSGENGHATAVVEKTTDGDLLYLFFQARSKSNPRAEDNNWRYGIATFAIESLKR